MSFSWINKLIRPWTNQIKGFRPIAPPTGYTGMGSGKMRPTSSYVLLDRENRNKKLKYD